MWKKTAVFALVSVVLASAVAAQSNQRIDELLSQAQARLDTTSYLILSSAGLVAEDADPQAAFDQAVETGLLTKGRHPDDPVTIEDLSYLLMKTQKTTGGIEWNVLPSPRAAFRELSKLNLVDPSAGPGRVVAGNEVVRTLNDVVEHWGGHP